MRVPRARDDRMAVAGTRRDCPSRRARRTCIGLNCVNSLGRSGSTPPHVMAFWLAIAAVVVTAVEVTSAVAIAMSRKVLVEDIRTTRDIYAEQSQLIGRLLAPDSTRMLVIDSVLGWRYRPGRSGIHTINAQGVRSSRTYAARPRPGVTRVAAFGDSFVFGSEVADGDAWSAQMERLSPAIEVLNYGVGGYGVDQAYIRFCTEGSDLASHVVIMAFAPDDMRRVTNVYRRFISHRELPLAKPRFSLIASGGLRLLPNPLPQPADYERIAASPSEITSIAIHDAWYQRLIYQNVIYDYSATARLVTNLSLRVYDRHFAPDRLLRGGEFSSVSEAFRIHALLFERFVTATRQLGAQPLIVLLPDREAVTTALRGNTTILRPLAEYLARSGLRYVDLTGAFVAAPGKDVDRWFMPGGHYSPAGNALVAEQLIREITSSTESGPALTPVATHRAAPPCTESHSR